MVIRDDLSGVVLRPNPAFVPNNINSSYRSKVITLEAFLPSPHDNEGDRVMMHPCPVRALSCYVRRTQKIRGTDQLLVCYVGVSLVWRG